MSGKGIDARHEMHISRARIAAETVSTLRNPRKPVPFQNAHRL